MEHTTAAPFQPSARFQEHVGVLRSSIVHYDRTKDEGPHYQPSPVDGSSAHTLKVETKSQYQSRLGAAYEDTEVLELGVPQQERARATPVMSRKFISWLLSQMKGLKALTVKKVHISEGVLSQAWPESVWSLEQLALDSCELENLTSLFYARTLPATPVNLATIITRLELYNILGILKEHELIGCLRKCCQFLEYLKLYNCFHEPEYMIGEVRYPYSMALKPHMRQLDMLEVWAPQTDLEGNLQFFAGRLFGFPGVFKMTFGLVGGTLRSFPLDDLISLIHLRHLELHVLEIDFSRRRTWCKQLSRRGVNISLLKLERMKLRIGNAKDIIPLIAGLNNVEEVTVELVDWVLSSDCGLVWEEIVVPWKRLAAKVNLIVHPPQGFWTSATTPATFDGAQMVSEITWKFALQRLLEVAPRVVSLFRVNLEVIVWDTRVPGAGRGHLWFKGSPENLPLMLNRRPN